MSFLKNIFRKKELDKRLEGIWRSDLDDKNTKESMGGVLMTFTNNGKLTYEIKDGLTLQTIKMTLRTVGNVIYSNQPSNPREESTEYLIENDNILILKHEGLSTRFLKR